MIWLEYAMAPHHQHEYRTDDGGCATGLQIYQRIWHSLLSHAFAVDEDQRLVANRPDGIFVETEITSLE